MKIKSGFTIVELVVVVVIIGILAAMALPQYTKTVERSRQSEAMVNLAAIRGAQTRHYLENANFTDNFADLDIDDISASGTFFTYDATDPGAATGIVANATRTTTKNPCGTTAYIISMYQNGTTSKSNCGTCSAVAGC